ncbi:hypothetical protein I317_00650 [Kwoniella heveanensis CBS 569]|nr:hypothetical protein I317_00650 [Kwoniella heveanensis CBS 569]
MDSPTSDRDSSLSSSSSSPDRNHHNDDNGELSPNPNPNPNPNPISVHPPESPSASAFFLRTAETLDGLAKQLGDIKDDAEGQEASSLRCCCGGGGEGGIVSGGCRMIRERDRMEDKLKLSGEIGNALLQRYEALERKYQREVEQYEHQLEVKRTSLAESVKRVNNLEKANHQHLQKFAEMSKKTEALEKRYTQAMHTQTLTQQSLTHVRAELTTLRATTARQNIALASGAGVEQRLADAEKRYEDARDLAENETKKTRDEMRKRKRAEKRIEELENQVKITVKEVEDIKEARAKDAQDLLANAKERLSELHSELSETFRADSPADMPEYQRTLEDLVANNTLLKHDVAELSHSLAESRDEARVMKEEVEELRSVIGTVGRMSPLNRMPPRLASELGSNHSLHTRTESSPIFAWGAGQGHGERGSWQRMSVASSSRTGGMSAWEHHRKMSIAASFTSTSTADGVTSPGLGMGPIGEFGGILMNEDGTRAGTLSPPPLDGRQSPKFRTSPSGGIGYVLNGVPKIKPPGHVRPALARSFSTNTDRRARRSYASQGVGPIAEWSGAEETANTSTDGPPSPGADYFRAAEANRKRRSLMLARRSTMSPNGSTEYSPNASNTLVEESIPAGYPSPMSDSVLTNTSPKRAKRKTLLLLTKSQGVQTDPVENNAPTEITPSVNSRRESLPAQGAVATSTGTSPIPPSEDHSETSSITDTRAGILLVVIEHMSKMLARLRDADVPTLNKRLKKHNLPGDVGHLSQSTMRSLQQEVAELRNQFKGIHHLGGIDRKDFNLLLRLFKDVFSDLVDLQAIVNDVTINPSLAKKLQKAAFKDEEEEAARAAKQASGLGWIAAPITKFFVTPADGAGNESTIAPQPGKGIERGRLQPVPVKAAPKQQATASATTTHVSVEFGGTGISRRATPAMMTGAAGVSDMLPPSPVPAIEGDRSKLTLSAGPGTGLEGGLAPPTARTVRRSKSRANRNELLGIFAGAPPRPATPAGGEPWTVLGQGHAQPSSSSGATGGKTLRSVSSQYFADKTIRAPREATDQRKRLSAVVDAIIDDSANQLASDHAHYHDSNAAVAGSYDPPLLERTLRPRGLSDSSIRSTFVSHANANPVEQAEMRGGRAPAYGSVVGGGMLQNLSRKWYEFRGPSTNEPSPVNPDGVAAATTAAPAAPPRPVEDRAGSTPNVTASTDPSDQARSPPRPIPVSPNTRSSSISTTASSFRNTASASASPSKRGSRARAISPTTVSSSQTGLFGLLATSLAGAGAVAGEMGSVGEDDHEDEMVGASLRQQTLIRGRSGGKGWE